MSTYGYFMVEVKTKEKGWQRLIWKSRKSDYPYLSDEKKNEPGEDYNHEYVIEGTFYNLRTCLRDEDFGNTFLCEDFTQETKDDIKKFKDDGYGWYEGYFYLNELSAFIKSRKEDLEKYKLRNINQAIFDEVRSISAKLDGKKYEKDKDEETPFDDWYEDVIEESENEIETLQYIKNAIHYIADEVFGSTNSTDIRVIIVAG